jgi:cytochrome c oxidase subunit 2
MSSPVHVVPVADFQKWVQEQQAQAGGTAGQQGEKYALQSGCTSCHSPDGHAMIGPTFKGLYGSQVTLQDGTNVTADDAYIRSSIVAPNAQVVQGFPADVMPKDYGTRLTGEQIDAIIAYIKSLK